MSFAVSFAPPVSKAVAGTQDGIIINTESGSHSVWSSMYWMPSVPQTFAISCASATMDVVPFANTVSANRDGWAMEDSICTCASMRPGVRNAPFASISVLPV